MENYFRKLVAFLTTFAVVTLIRQLADEAERSADWSKGLSHFANLSVTVL